MKCLLDVIYIGVGVGGELAPRPSSFAPRTTHVVVHRPHCHSSLLPVVRRPRSSIILIVVCLSSCPSTLSLSLSSVVLIINWPTSSSSIIRCPHCQSFVVLIVDCLSSSTLVVRHPHCQSFVVLIVDCLSSLMSVVVLVVVLVIHRSHR